MAEPITMQGVGKQLKLVYRFCKDGRAKYNARCGQTIKISLQILNLERKRMCKPKRLSWAAYNIQPEWA
jgi:hypothetical protein